MTPVKDNIEKINTKIVYSTVVELLKDNIEKDDLEKIILVDVPSEVYAEIRKIFINLFENSGFKDIKINENVDFKKLYDMRRVQ